MPASYDVDALRTQIAQDLEVFKAEKARFYRLQDSAPEEVTPADRNAIINWSRASISDHAVQLERMEEIDEPTKEEKQVMQLLNQLVSIGDQIGEFTTAFIRRYEEKFGKGEDTPVDLPEGAYLNAEGKVVIRKCKEPGILEREAAGITHSRSGERKAPSAPKASKSAGDAPAIARDDVAEPITSDPTIVHTHQVEEEYEDDEPAEATHSEPESPDLAGEDFEFLIDPDPKGVYALLGVAPDAETAQLKRQVPCDSDFCITLMVDGAIKLKLMQLHPDRRPTNSNAASEVSEFKALCAETVETEEKREAYGDIRTAEELDDLTKRVRQLTMGDAAHTAG